MKRGAVVGIVAGAVAVVVAGAAGVWFATRGESIEDAAQRYVTALEKGDSQTIDALIEAPPVQGSAVMKAFENAAARPQHATLTVGRENGRHRVPVTVHADFAGAPHEFTFEMAGGDSGWKVVGGATGTVDVTTDIGDAVLIGDQLFPAADPNQRIGLLPAVYRVQAAPAEILDGETTVVIAPGEKPTTVTVRASLSPGATALVQQQLDAYAAACAKPATAVPAHCGLRVPWGADLSALKSLAFRVEKTPAVVLAADAASFDATGGVIVATARGTSRAGGAGEFTYRADDWALRGTVSFHDGEMVLAVR